MFKNKDDNIKWYTESEFVDEDTGEIIPRHYIESGLYVKTIKKEIKNEFDEKVRKGKRKFTFICRRNEQYKLF